jgi:hypothetical protein
MQEIKPEVSTSPTMLPHSHSALSQDPAQLSSSLNARLVLPLLPGTLTFRDTVKGNVVPK